MISTSSVEEPQPGMISASSVEEPQPGIISASSVEVLKEEYDIGEGV